MKMDRSHSFPLAIGLALAVFFAAGVESLLGCDGCTNKAELKIPETAHGILQALQEHNAHLAGIIATNKLPPAIWVLGTMSVLAKALPAKAPAEMKASVQEKVKQLAEASKKLGRAALTESRTASATQLGKFQARLKTLSALFNYQPPKGLASQRAS